MGRPRRLDRAFYARTATEVAPELLNKVLVTPNGTGRIVEVEAYEGADDPGSHGFRGPTPRTEVMFGPPGRLYVYFTYGMHWCANVVCAEPGQCSAVLLRAVEPLVGIEAMRARRPRAKRDRDLTNGPAKLCAALDIGEADKGLNLLRAERGITVVDDGVGALKRPERTTRIGLSAGADLRLRWYVPDSPWVSRR